MRILGSVVAPSAALMAFCDSKIMGRGSIRPQLIRDELVWDKAIFLQKFAHQFQRGTLVSSALDQHVEHFALGVDGTPQIDHAAIDLEIDFVEMPSRMWLRPAFGQRPGFDADPHRTRRMLADGRLEFVGMARTLTAPEAPASFVKNVNLRLF
jgi:hypothetical protein